MSATVPGTQPVFAMRIGEAYYINHNGLLSRTYIMPGVNGHDAPLCMLETG